MANNFWEIRLVFDRYVKDFLKARTLRKRTSGKEVRYRISDKTGILNVNLKQLLSHIETKQGLTVYLSRKFIDAFCGLIKGIDNIWYQRYHTFIRNDLLPINQNQNLDYYLIAFAWKAQRFTNAFFSFFLSPQLFRNIGEFEARKYFTDHQITNTVQLFAAKK